MTHQISVDIPAEPENHTVVTDQDGLAWQRVGNTWLAPGATLFGGRSWARLLLDRGPLTVLVPSPLNLGRMADRLDTARHLFVAGGYSTQRFSDELTYVARVLRGAADTKTDQPTTTEEQH